MDNNDKDTGIRENSIHIAMTAGAMIAKEQIAVDDYQGLLNSIVYWAEQFEEMYGNYDFESGVLDYFDLVENYATIQLLEDYGKPVYSSVVKRSEFSEKHKIVQYFLGFLSDDGSYLGVPICRVTVDNDNQMEVYVIDEAMNLDATALKEVYSFVNEVKEKYKPKSCVVKKDGTMNSNLIFSF